jgi:hypothetical protein
VCSYIGTDSEMRRQRILIDILTSSLRPHALLLLVYETLSYECALSTDSETLRQRTQMDTLSYTSSLRP